MNLFPNYSDIGNDTAILLSIKPKFASLIVDGSKRVELRRSVPAQPVGTIVIYSSSPVQSIVALVDVKEIIKGTPTKLWSIAKENGGGVTRKELFAYFESKAFGFALMLENVRVFEQPVNPKKFFKNFSPPQSFKYLTPNELKSLEKLLKIRCKE